MLRSMHQDIACIFERDPAARSKWEVFFCYPGLHALWFYRVSHWLWVHDWKVLGRWISHVGRFLTGIEIHPGAKLGQRVFMDHGMGIVIGETAEVGDDCTIYHGVTLGGTSLAEGTKRHPTLESGVIVGAGAKILGSFTVGANARIGSNAVVVKPVPANVTAVGNPARLIDKNKKEEPKTKVETPEDSQFAAYGVIPNEEDPYAKQIGELQNIVHDQALQLRAMTLALEAQGIKLSRQAESESE